MSSDIDYSAKLAKWYSDYNTLMDSETSCKKYTLNARNYEKDSFYLGYPTPKVLVEMITTEMFQDKLKGNEKIYVLDAGCGTGLVGEYFKQSPSSNHWVIDGFDGAEGMLDIARKKGVYRRLETCFMVRKKESISKFNSDEYDLVVASGLFAFAQAWPSGLSELVRVTKPGGCIIFTFGKNQPEDYQAEMKNEIRRIEDSNLWQVIKVEEIDYLGRQRDGVSDGIKSSDSNTNLVKCYAYCCVKI